MKLFAWMDTICVEMNVYALLNHVMTLALKTQPFVEIDASMRDTGIKSITHSPEIDSCLMFSFNLLRSR